MAESGIGEVGNSVDEVFITRGREMAERVQGVAGLVGRMTVQFEAAAVGSHSPHVEALRGYLANHAKSLADLLLGIDAASKESQQLLASWGLGSAGTEARPGDGEQPAICVLVKPDSASAGGEGSDQPNYDSTLSILFHEDSEGKAPGLGRTIFYLKRIGVDTARKAFLYGGQYIAERAVSLGASRVDVLRQKLAEIFPDTPLSDAPDPVIGARLGASLEDLPAKIFGFYPRRGNEKSLSAKDLIDYPTLGKAIPGLPDSFQNVYARARLRALDYAEKFEEAKRAQQ
ncbi:MAG TPA: hypothetical protein VMR45_02630 [Patescibacteria group bacterium]|nr:hypothetical protein [Patescibacteria group bacterium]